METLDDDVGMLVEERIEGKTLVLVAIYAINRAESSVAREEKYKISLSFLLNNVLDELLNHRFPHEITSFKDTSIFVFTLSPEEIKLFEDQIASALTELQDFFAQNLFLRIEAVIGKYSMDSSQLCDIYQQVKLAHAQNSAAGNHSILWVSSNQRQNVENLPLDVYIEPLCEAIRHLSWNDSRHISEALFEALYESDKSYTAVHFYIMAVVKQLSDSYLTGGNGGNSELLKFMQEMAKCQDVPELKQAFLNILQLLCDHHSVENPVVTEDIHLRVKHYVNQNYSDINLNLVQISENIGLSPKYVSRLFKIETGKRLPDYIIEVRISKAKELIAQGNLTLNSIAGQVGFNSMKTFRRAFQKIENINPSNY